MFRSLSMVWLIGLFWSACTTSSSSDKRLLTEDERRSIDEYRSEVELGRDMAGRLLQFYGTYNDEELMRYVNDVGLFLTSFSDYKDRRYMFTVLDTKIVNAFACPGGYILITRGTLLALKNEAELAGVLGHEIIHVGKKHIFTTLMNLDPTERSKFVEEVDKGLSTDIATRDRRRVSSSYTSDTGAWLARYMSGSAGAGITLLQAAKAGMLIILDKGLDQKLEYEADEMGVQLAVRAGYDPFALENFLKRLNDPSQKVDTKMLEKTHPKLLDRVAAIDKTLSKIQAQDIVAASGEQRFLKHTAKLHRKAE